MQGVFAAETAVFVECKSVGVVFLVFLCVIVTLFAFAASKSDFNSHLYRHLLENFERIAPFSIVPPSASGQGADVMTKYLRTKKEPSA